MNSQLFSIAVMLGGMQLGKRIDFEQPDNLFLLRAVYVVSNLLIFAAIFYIKLRIGQANDLTTIKYVEPASPMSGRENDTLVTTTVREYDENKLREAQKTVFMGVAMMGFMHLYMRYSQPLIAQSIMPLKTLYDNNLFKIYVLGQQGEEFKRPFKPAPGLFGAPPAGPKTDKKSIQELEAKAVLKKEE